jgi:hypothetical protein
MADPVLARRRSLRHQFRKIGNATGTFPGFNRLTIHDGDSG